MSASDDFPRDMHKYPFDDSDADAVFGSSSGADAVPEDLRDLAELVDAARRAGSADELVGEDVIVGQIAAAVGVHVSSAGTDTASPPADAHERISVLSKFRTAKLAAAATAIVVLGATAAAAATGSLPTPVQSSVAKGLSGVGISVPADQHVALASKDVPAAASRHHLAGKHHGPHVSGVVASVNGVSDPNTCGTSGGSGSFTLTGHKGTLYVVNVATTTAFVDKAVTDASFANVCVGALVTAKGSAVDTTVTATKIFIAPPRPPHQPKGAFGVVASVNGVSDPNTCGTSGAAGTFTLTGHKNTTLTVNVATTTAFAENGVTTPSFANLCVGEFVAAKGTVTDTTVAATNVFIAPVRHDGDQHMNQGVFGTVLSVNGVSDPNTCGTSGATGTFTLSAWMGQTITVNVDTNTKFFAPGVSDPSFVNVCVGAKVGAKGDVTGSTVAATVAFVLPKFNGSQFDGTKNCKHGGGIDFKGGHGQPSNGPDLSHKGTFTGFQPKPGFGHSGRNHHSGRGR